MHPDWRLTGRREELARIARAIRSPGTAAIVLVGAAGVGRTRLVQEALSRAQRAGFATEWAGLSRARAGIPFGALAHLLPAATAGPLDLLAARQSILEAAGGRPLVIAVDDAHLLDDRSAALLQELAETRAAFVLLTLPSGEPTPEAIVDLWKEGVADRLEVTPFSRSTVEELLVGALGGPVEGATAHTLWHATRGNALLATELVRGGLDSGALAPVDGLWTWQGRLAAPRLPELVEARFGSLEPAEREVVEMLALAEPLGVALLETIARPDALERLERRGLLLTERHGRRSAARLVHPLDREIVRSSLLPLRVRALSRQLADAVDASGTRRRSDLVQATTLKLDAGERCDPELLVAAARHATAGFDYDLAERTAATAWVAGGGFAAGVCLARALTGQGRYGEALDLLGRLHHEASDDEQRAELAAAHANVLLWHLGVPDGAEEELLGAAHQVVEPSWQEELAALKAMLLLWQGQPAAALELASSVLVTPPLRPTAHVRASLVAALALAISGRCEEAVATVERSMPLAQRLASELPLATGELTTARLLAFWLSGRLREALQLARELYDLSLQAGLTDWAAFCSALEGRMALALGQVQTAFRSFRDAVTRFRVEDRLGFLPWSLGGLAQAAALTGAHEAADAALAEADAARTGAHRFLDVDIELGRAWVLASRGEGSRALEIATSAAERCSALGQHAFAALAWHDVARLGGGERATSELSQLATSIDGEMVAIMAAHAEAIATGDAEALEAVSERLEAREAMLVAAEAAARAGAVHRAHHRLGDARRCWGRSRGLQLLAEDAITPALATLGEPDGLTRREREVATLAARSLASRVIAERLAISVRTVDNHLYQAYRKLGVSGRRELRSVLGPLSVDVGA